jgi:hypothetical protein
MNYEWTTKPWMEIHVNEFHSLCDHVQYWHPWQFMYKPNLTINV